eukprot:Platyproteum_vivax@DN7220_c0_g1_i3.p1
MALRMCSQMWDRTYASAIHRRRISICLCACIGQITSPVSLSRFKKQTVSRLLDQDKIEKKVQRRSPISRNQDGLPPPATNASFFLQPPVTKDTGVGPSGASPQCNRLRYWPRRLVDAPLSGDVSSLQVFQFRRCLVSPVTSCNSDVAQGYASLTVNIHSMTRLPQTSQPTKKDKYSWKPTLPDPYVKILYNGLEYFQTEVNMGGPTIIQTEATIDNATQGSTERWDWNESFAFQVYHPVHLVILEVWDFDVWGCDERIGSVALPLWALTEQKRCVLPLFALGGVQVGALNAKLQLNLACNHAELAAACLPLYPHRELPVRHPLVARLLSLSFLTPNHPTTSSVTSQASSQCGSNWNYASYTYRFFVQLGLMRLCMCGLLYPQLLQQTAKTSKTDWPTIENSLTPIPWWSDQQRQSAQDPLPTTSKAEVNKLEELCTAGVILKFRVWNEVVGPVLSRIEDILLWRSSMKSFIALVAIWLFALRPSFLVPAVVLYLLIKTPSWMYYFLWGTTVKEPRRSSVTNPPKAAWAQAVWLGLPSMGKDLVEIANRCLWQVIKVIDSVRSIKDWQATNANSIAGFCMGILLAACMVVYVNPWIITTSLNLTVALAAYLPLLLRVVAAALLSVLLLSATRIVDAAVRLVCGILIMQGIKNQRLAYPLNLTPENKIET